MVACSVLVNGDASIACPSKTGRVYIATPPGSRGIRNGLVGPVSNEYSSLAITNPFHPCKVDCGHGRRWSARLRCRRRVLIRSNVGRGSNDGRLAPTSVVTSSNVMVTSILSKLVLELRYVSLLGYFRTVESVETAAKLPLRLD